MIVDGRDTHPEFIGRLEDSEPARQAFAEFIRGLGFPAEVPPLKHAPTHEEAYKYRDSGDVFVLDRDGKQWRIEVKGRHFNFTCGEDYEYPDVYVSRVDSVKRSLADPRMWFWAIVSADLKYAGLIHHGSEKEWRETGWMEIKDGTRENNMACPKWCVWWLRMEPKRR